MAHFTGIWPALVTPLKDEPGGDVDLAATARLVEGLLSTGIGGLYVCGGTGEGVLLAPEARRTMAEEVMRIVAGRVPVMVHIGAINTATAVDLARHASALGVAAISAVPPFYFSFSFRAVADHYRAILAASSVPLYLYHIPGATGSTVTPEQLLELCELPGVGGLKYSSHDLYGLSRLLAARDPERINVLSGPDELFLPCCALGCDGAIGTTYNLMPRLYRDLRENCLRGDLATARRLQYAANRVIGVLLKYGAIPATKAALGMLGYAVGQGMPPMPPIVGDELAALRRELEAVGFFELVKRPALYGVAGDAMRGHLA